MKNYSLLLFSVLVTAFLANEASAQNHRLCANPDIYQGSEAKNISAGSKVFEQWISKIEQMESEKRIQDNDEIYTIPVVVHVLHNGEAEGTGRNLSMARIQSQIRILNQDYGRESNTPGFNSHPDGADTRIRFCLANTDPNGQPSNGVVRVNTNQDGFAFLTDNILLKGFSFWDPNKYLNIWTCKISGNLYIGYAQYPIISTFWADSLPMIQPIPDIQPDGVVIDYRVFGDVPAGEGAPFNNYNKGRTTTHEIGHYLGLLHIWGDGTACADNATDFCSDTPPQATYTSGCPQNQAPSCIQGVSTMKENYLDYTNDACMNIFTKDQKRRMRMVLRNCVRRKTLLLNTPALCSQLTDTQPPVPPVVELKELLFYFKDNDPSTDEINIQSPDRTTLKEILVYDYIGQQMTVGLNKDQNLMRLYIHSLPSGVYLAKVRTEDGKIYKRRFWKK